MASTPPPTPTRPTAVAGEMITRPLFLPLATPPPPPLSPVAMTRRLNGSLVATAAVTCCSRGPAGPPSPRHDAPPFQGADTAYPLPLRAVGGTVKGVGVGRPTGAAEEDTAAGRAVVPEAPAEGGRGEPCVDEGEWRPLRGERLKLFCRSSRCRTAAPRGGGASVSFLAPFPHFRSPR